MTLDELVDALNEIIDDKSSSLGGYPWEFYKATWDFVEIDSLQVYKESIQSQMLGDLINKG